MLDMAKVLSGLSLSYADYQRLAQLGMEADYVTRVLAKAQHMVWRKG